LHAQFIIQRHNPFSDAQHGAGKRAQRSSATSPRARPEVPIHKSSGTDLLRPPNYSSMCAPMLTTERTPYGVSESLCSSIFFLCSFFFW
jgi:hypothetical protein